jgi:hypothetical protein
MSHYPSNNRKQIGPYSDNRSSNIAENTVLLPKNLLLEIHNPKHRTKMKPKNP